MTSPKFHCSRCDYLFELEEPFTSDSSQKSKVASPPDDSTRPPRYSIREEDPPIAQSRKSSVGTSEVVDDSLAEDPPAIEPRVTTIISSVEEYFSESPTEQRIQETEVVSPQVQSISEPPPPSEEQLEEREELEEIESIEEISPPPPLQTELPLEAKPSVRPTPPPRFGEIPSNSPKGPIVTLSRNRWKGAAIIGAPRIGVVLGFFLLTIYFQYSPELLVKLVPTLFPSTRQASPPELIVGDSKIRLFTLDTGDSVALLTGVLINSGSQILQDIEVEGALFNGAGDVLNKQRSFASPTLARSRLESLSPEMISSIQSTKPRKGSTLRGGEKVDFSIALIGPEVKKARFFTTRVYSVRR